MKKYTFPFFPFTSKKLLKLFSTISRRLGASSFFFSFLSAIYGSNPSEVGDLKPHLCFFFVSSLFALACLLHITGCVFALMHSDRTVWLQQRLSKSVERITIFLFFFSGITVQTPERRRFHVDAPQQHGSVWLWLSLFFFCHTLVYARALRIIQKNNCEQKSYVRGERRR